MQTSYQKYPSSCWLRNRDNELILVPCKVRVTIRSHWSRQCGFDFAQAIQNFVSKLVPRLIQTQPRISYQLDRFSDSWCGKHCRADAKHVGHILQILRCVFVRVTLHVQDAANSVSRKISSELKATSGESGTTCGQIRAGPLCRSYCSDTSKLAKCTTPTGVVNFKHHCTLHCPTVFCRSLQSELLVSLRQQNCIKSRFNLGIRSPSSLLLEGAEVTHGITRFLRENGHRH